MQCENNINAKFSLQPQEEMVVKFTLNPDSTTDHTALINRDAPDQHPIASITGLQDELDNINDSIKNIPDLEEIQNHISDFNNPHKVTKEQLGLENIDNTSDMDKPISRATQTALDEKAPKSNTLEGYGIEDAYNISEIDEKFSVKSDIPTKLSDLENDVDFINHNDLDESLNGKADKSTTLEGYGIEDAYTKDVIQQVALTGDYNDLLNKPDPYELPIATANTLGGVKIGKGVVSVNGVIQVDTSSIDAVSTINGKQGDVILTSDDIMYKDKTVYEILDELLYEDPIVKLSGGNNFENGSSNTINLTWTINKDIISQSLNNNIGEIDKDLRKYTIENVTSNKTYTISVNDGKKIASSSTNVNFLNKRYWGVSKKDTLSNDEILSLSNELTTSRIQNRTFDCSGGKYFYFVIPTTLCNGIKFTVGGLSFSNLDIQTINVTNKFNHTIQYNIYRPVDIQTGSSIEVKIS